MLLVVLMAVGCYCLHLRRKRLRFHGRADLEEEETILPASQPKNHQQQQYYAMTSNGSSSSSSALLPGSVMPAAAGGIQWSPAVLLALNSAMLATTASILCLFVVRPPWYRRSWQWFEVAVLVG